MDSSGHCTESSPPGKESVTISASRRSPLFKPLLIVGVILALAVGAFAPSLQTFSVLALALLLLSSLLFLLPKLLRSARGVFSLRVPPEWVLLASTLCLCLVLSEGALRFFLPLSVTDIENMALWGRSLGYRYHRTLGWLPVPDSHLTVDTGRMISVVHNSRGFRDAEPAVDTRPGILFLGDSFVWGYNVQAEERFSDRLRDRHPEWQVYNCGICAYSTDQEYLLLQKHFEAYRPRIVFLIFCAENDEAGNASNLCGQWYFKPYFTVGAKGLQLQATPVPGSERVFCVEHPLLCRSYLARLAVRAWGNLRSPPPPPGINPTTAILQALQAYVSSHGADLYVGLTASHPQLQEFLQHSNIPYVDLSTDLRYDSDGHWTSDGHAFVAEKIDAFLRSKSVLQTKLKSSARAEQH